MGIGGGGGGRWPSSEPFVAVKLNFIFSCNSKAFPQQNWDYMDCCGAYNNSGSRVRGTIPSMEHVSAGVDCRSPDPELGPSRNKSYPEAVQMILANNSTIKGGGDEPQTPRPDTEPAAHARACATWFADRRAKVNLQLPKSVDRILQSSIMRPK
ncbi:unnamed protein product [Ilex paraguariensis]|uniref:Uncharacterized protein n=1 Tax=Ilex paraguariensis TaxID=185542 RepID=A0ABC8RY08_9AQUA